MVSNRETKSTVFFEQGLACYQSFRCVNRAAGLICLLPWIEASHNDGIRMYHDFKWQIRLKSKTGHCGPCLSRQHAGGIGWMAAASWGQPGLQSETLRKEKSKIRS